MAEKKKLIPIVGSTGLIKDEEGNELFVTVTEKTTHYKALMVTDDGIAIEAKLGDLKLAWKKP